MSSYFVNPLYSKYKVAAAAAAAAAGEAINSPYYDCHFAPEAGSQAELCLLSDVPLVWHRLVAGRRRRQELGAASCSLVLRAVELICWCEVSRGKGDSNVDLNAVKARNGMGIRA
ncbi:hypothetical protein DUI87_04409 [Hirundo rustica rustica]|uniref:Uncharacterized protein n=1 Tax=Hirundo rustica rustica TaxID=333673 RepID=A0A3M0KZ37_HIRRU|nr:hypothetical protein DUI87_04409 [Hirundo rustica rustica]